MKRIKTESQNILPQLYSWQTGMPIFVEHWGDNLQFYPNFALFSTLGGMNLDHDFAQVSKLSKDQKKRVFTKNRTLFSRNSSAHLRSDAHQSQIIGRDANVDNTQTIGGNTVKLLGGYISRLPRVSAPLLARE